MFMPISLSLMHLGERDFKQDAFCITGERQSGCYSPEMGKQAGGGWLLAFILAFSQFRKKCPFQIQMLSPPLLILVWLFGIPSSSLVLNQWGPPHLPSLLPLGSVSIPKDLIVLGHFKHLRWSESFLAMGIEHGNLPRRHFICSHRRFCPWIFQSPFLRHTAFFFFLIRIGVFISNSWIALLHYVCMLILVPIHFFLKIIYFYSL